MIEVQCSSCHTRYRVDEQVLPEGTPTFKCSRCGHVFSVEPRAGAPSSAPADETQPARDPGASRVERKSTPPEAAPTSAPKAGSQVPREEASPSRSTESARPPDPPPPTTIAHETPPKPANAEVRARPSTAELFSRSFNLDDMRSDEGENLSFDFRDDAGLVDQEHSDRNEPASEAAPPQPAATRPRLVPDPAAPPLEVDAFTPARDFAIGDPDLSDPPRTPSRPRKTRAEEFLDETAAPVYNRGVTHSARFFLGLFAFVALGFAGTTMTIHAAPAVARDLLSRLPVLGYHFVSPLTPARMVALQNVHTEYLRSRDGRPALVVQGDARNVSAGTLHTIKITAHFDLTPGAAGVTRDAYCGNSLGAQMVNQMTPHEIEFYQRLPPPGGFTLAASAACPFVIVLLDPPIVQGLQLAVTEAEPAAIALSGTPGS